MNGTSQEAAATETLADDRTGYRAIVEEYDGQPNQCTIFPVQTSGFDRMATWLSARGDAFVDVEEWR